MISAPRPYELKQGEIETLLKRLEDWKFGICPNGRLANKGCFVLETRPSIVVRADITKPVATQVITDSEWTENLVINGTIQHINDSALINTLADLYMIFGSTVVHQVTHDVHKIHAIQIRKYATISTDAILRPTDQMKESIEKALAETDVTVRWNKLLEFWDEYGYFWPRKIIFGFRNYFQKTFSFRNQGEQYSRYHTLNSQLHRDLNNSKLPIYDTPTFLEKCDIVGRDDLIPLHELLDNEWKERIKNLINEKFVRILVNQPIKIFNRSKKSYLCWRPRHGEAGTISSMFVVQPLQEREIQVERSSQYVWKLGWTSKRDTAPTAGLDYDTDNYRPRMIRGSERVYVFPGCKTRVHSILNSQSTSQQTTTPDSRIIHTDKLILSCLSYSYKGDPHQDSASRVRALQLSPPRDHPADEITNWTIEYHRNLLKYAMEHEYHVNLNINEHIRRFKPLVHGDEIQLQQIGFLTAFDTDETSNRPSTSSPIVYPRNARYFQHRDARMPKSKRVVRCMDGNMLVYRENVVNTYWTLQVATSEDLKRHSMDSRHVEENSGHNQRPHLTTSHTTTYLENGYSNQHHQHQHQQQQHQQQQQQAESSYTLRRTQSDSSVPTCTSNINHQDRAAHFESLAKSSTSKLLMKFMKRVTLQPLVQFVHPARTRQSPNHQQAYPNMANQTDTQPHEYPTQH